MLAGAAWQFAGGWQVNRRLAAVLPAPAGSLHYSPHSTNRLLQVVIAYTLGIAADAACCHVTLAHVIASQPCVPTSAGGHRLHAGHRRHAAGLCRGARVHGLAAVGHRLHDWLLPVRPPGGLSNRGSAGCADPLDAAWMGGWEDGLRRCAHAARRPEHPCRPIAALALLTRGSALAAPTRRRPPADDDRAVRRGAGAPRVGGRVAGALREGA